MSPDTLWLLIIRHLRKAGYPVEKNQLGFLDWIKLGIIEMILEQLESGQGVTYERL